MAKHNEETSPLPAALIALGAIAVGGFIAYTIWSQDSAAAALESQSVDLERPTKDVTLQQRGELVAPAAWADKAKGTATVPIDRAMQIVVKTLQENPAAASPPPPPPKEPDADAGVEGDAGDATATSNDDAAVTDDGGEATADAGAAPGEPQPKPEQPKLEQPKPEAPKPPQPKPEQPKPPQPQPEQPKPEQPLE